MVTTSDILHIRFAPERAGPATNILLFLDSRGGFFGCRAVWDRH